MSNSLPTQNEKPPSDRLSVNRAKVESIDLYEVTDHELNILEKGSEGGLYLNFSLFLISAAISFFITLTTTTIDNERQFTVFCVIAFSFTIGSMILALLWWKSRESVKSITNSIRQRMAPVGETSENSKSDTSTEKSA